MCVNMYIYMCVEREREIIVYIYICMHVCMYIYMYMHVCMTPN